jgi:N4-gp56 family major capsid protein
MPYAPPSLMTQSPGQAQQATVYYDRIALDRLEAMFRFAQICEPHPIPLNSGKTIQMFRTDLPGFNTTPSAEGVIPTPIAQTNRTISATVEQYSDFMSSSTLLNDTDINPTTERMVKDMSYRASGSTDTIIRTEIDSNTSAMVNTIGSYFTASDAKSNVALLEGINVRPLQGSKFVGIIHPYIAYDLISDNTAGGFIDSLKYQNGQQVLNGEVGEVANTRWLMTTNVGTTGSSPNVLYYTYIFGEGGVGMVDLSGKGPDKVVDPRNQRFKVNIVPGGPNTADPTGEIASFVSYRFVFAAKTLDTTNYRFYIVKSNASLV